jgi:hypothetical protein
VPTACSVYEEVIMDNSKISFTKKKTINCSDLKCIDDIKEMKFRIMDLIKVLPDIYLFLKELYIEPEIYRGQVERRARFNYDIDENGQTILNKILVNNQIYINEISHSRQNTIIDLYEKMNPEIKLINRTDNTMAFELVTEGNEKEHKTYYFPDTVDDLYDTKYFIGRPAEYIIEPAAHFIILFCLGMICRYYPDIWMKAIDQNVRIVELSDTLLGILYRKFPNLMLDQMPGIKYYIHS